MPFIVSNCVLSVVYSKFKLSTSHKVTVVDSDDEGEVASEECHCDRSKKRTDVFNPSEFHIKKARWIFNNTTES